MQTPADLRRYRGLAHPGAPAKNAKRLFKRIRNPQFYALQEFRPRAVDEVAFARVLWGGVGRFRLWESFKDRLLFYKSIQMFESDMRTFLYALFVDLPAAS